VNEWTKLDPAENENARQHLRRHGVPVPLDAGILSIGPLTIRQLNLFAHKAVLALYFEHFRQPLPITGGVSAVWKTKEDFAPEGVPQFLLDIMPGYRTLMQGRWNEQKTFEYRHANNAKGGLFGCLAKLRRGLFIAGFAAPTQAYSHPMMSIGSTPPIPRRCLIVRDFRRKFNRHPPDKQMSRRRLPFGRALAKPTRRNRPRHARRSVRRGQFVEHYQRERRWRRSNAKPSGLKMCDGRSAPACRWRRAHADPLGSNDRQC
jgi:hypothetical protein